MRSAVPYLRHILDVIAAIEEYTHNVIISQTFLKELEDLPPDGGGLLTDHHGQAYGQETLPNASLPTDHHGRAAVGRPYPTRDGQETLPNARALRSGDLTQREGGATVGRPCPTR
ncbi:MAG: hypothetical protein L6435_03365, partial [Anaerolineae bacterium]|nr:hypothetical protein [Anaerolineae bacterium]